MDRNTPCVQWMLQVHSISINIAQRVTCYSHTTCGALQYLLCGISFAFIQVRLWNRKWHVAAMQRLARPSEMSLTQCHLCSCAGVQCVLWLSSRCCQCLLYPSAVAVEHCVCTHVHACVVRMRVCVRVCACTYVCVHEWCVYVMLCARARTCVQVCVCIVSVNVLLYVCVHVHVCMWIRTYSPDKCMHIYVCVYACALYL